MNTNELIEQLANDLEPVARLRSPLQRSVFWLLGAGIYLVALAFLVASIHPAGYQVDSGLFVSQMAGVIAGSAAVLAAFASVIPGNSNVAKWAVAPLVVIWFLAFAAAAQTGDALAVGNAHHEWLCVGIILVGGSPLVAAMVVLLRRGAPLRPSMTGLLVALAAGSLANFAACLSLPHGNPAEAFVWHGGALLGLILVCVIGARLVLRW